MHRSEKQNRRLFVNGLEFVGREANTLYCFCNEIYVAVLWMLSLKMSCWMNQEVPEFLRTKAWV